MTTITQDTETGITVDHDNDQTASAVELSISENAPTSAKASKAEMVRALMAAVTAGSITKAQAAQFRRELGISQAVFTRKRLTKIERKSKRKNQRLARRANR